MSAPKAAVPEGISLDNWLEPPYSQWSLQHVEDFVPTAVISRGHDAVAELPVSRTSLADIAVPAASGPAGTVGAVMATTATDGWAVAQGGSLVAEEYSGGMCADSRHLVFSVSKSLLGVVAGALHGDGAIALDAPVTDYVAALANSGYAGATVRDLLDMRTGIAFSDDYLDPDAEIHALEQAVGWQPRSGADMPSTLYEYLPTLRQQAVHGEAFAYRSCDTDVLGWVCEVAGGQPGHELMSELLWGRIGARCAATIGVDAAGTGFFDGGVSTCLTDLIRFGSLFLRDGVSLTGQQVLPADWVADTLVGGPDSREAFAANPDNSDLPGGMYRNQMWLPHPGDNVVMCLGMCGQMIYVNRAADMVAAKLSTQPPSAEPHMVNTLRAFDAVARALAG